MCKGEEDAGNNMGWVEAGVSVGVRVKVLAPGQTAATHTLIPVVGGQSVSQSVTRSPGINNQECFYGGPGR